MDRGMSAGGGLLLLLILVGAVALATVIVTLPGQERAAAEAYAVRRAADVQAAESRAAIRQAEREAGHQRSLEVLPYVLAIITGAVLLGGLGAVVVLVLNRPRQPDPLLLAYLERQRLEQAELWRAVAQLDRNRQRLASGGNGKEMIIYDKQQ